MTSLGTPGPEPTMILSAVDPSIGEAATLTVPETTAPEAGEEIEIVGLATVMPMEALAVVPRLSLTVAERL